MKIETFSHPVLVRRSLRGRMRYWWKRRCMSDAERQLEDELQEQLEVAMLFGSMK